MSAIAQIVEIHADSHQPLGQPLTVDFNPQSLRLSHTATGPPTTKNTSTAKAENSPVPRQQTGYTTQLTVDLVFDTSRDGTDVRARTAYLVALTLPKDSKSAAGKAARFSWGSFLLDGYVDSMSETIDLFSPNGVPLRASVSLGMRGLGKRDKRPDSAAGLGVSAGIGGGVSAGAGVSAGIGASFGASAGAGASFGASAGAGVSAGAGAGAGVGASFGGGLSASAGATASFSASASASASLSAGVATTPLVLTTSGDTVQSIAARAGVSWKAVAAANGIDNPRLLPPGTVLDVRVAVR